MALSIRNPVAEELVRDLSRRTGKGITGTIIEALEHELQRRTGGLRASSLETEILDISRRCAALPDEDARSGNEVIGYDEYGGLPAW